MDNKIIDHICIVLTIVLSFASYYWFLFSFMQILSNLWLGIILFFALFIFIFLETKCIKKHLALFTNKILPSIAFLGGLSIVCGFIFNINDTINFKLFWGIAFWSFFAMVFQFIGWIFAGGFKYYLKVEMAICDECKGTGIIMNKNLCIKCKGTGIVTI